MCLNIIRTNQGMLYFSRFVNMSAPQVAHTEMSLKTQSNFILFGIYKPSSLKLITLSSESFQLDSRFDETVPRLMTLLIHIRWIPHQKKTPGETQAKAQLLLESAEPLLPSSAAKRKWTDNSNSCFRCHE